MRLAAFFTLYKMCILLHRCNLKIFAKSRFENQQFSSRFESAKSVSKICNLRSRDPANPIKNPSAWLAAGLGTCKRDLQDIAQQAALFWLASCVFYFA